MRTKDELEAQKALVLEHTTSERVHKFIDWSIECPAPIMVADEAWEVLEAIEQGYILAWIRWQWMDCEPPVMLLDVIRQWPKRSITD